MRPTVRRIAIKQRVRARRVRAEPIGEIVVVAGAGVGCPAVGAAGVLVAGAGVALVHVDGGVGLLVVGRHGEGGLVRVDVGAAGELALVVAREGAVGAPDLVGVEADEGGGDPGGAAGVLVSARMGAEDMEGMAL